MPAEEVEVDGKRTGVWTNAVIWFGAAVSIAEIEAGFQCGGQVAAILLGHIVGGLLLFGAGLVGARTRLRAMESLASSFGAGGARFFAALNILQLVGWTAVMVAQGAAAMNAISHFPLAACCCALGLLVAIWIFVGLDDSLHLATIAMSLLAILAIVMTARLGRLPAAAAAEGAAAEGPDFWEVFELSVAMPLSWLPLISDYTRRAARPVAATAASASVYTAVGCWMYMVGLLVARSGEPGLAEGVLKAGMGVVGLLVVVFSTVTTTFLDAFSAGESSTAIHARSPARPIALAVCVVGTAIAVFCPMERYADFLYLIASVFAPMAAVQLVDFFVTRRHGAVLDCLAWLAGFAAYHACLGKYSSLAAFFHADIGWSFRFGATIPAMAVSAAATLLGLAVRRRPRQKETPCNAL